MKFAFLLDQPQTLQTLFSVIRETSNADINSDIYLVKNNMDGIQGNFHTLLENLGNNYGLINANIDWKISESREHIQDSLIEQIENYDAVIGINLYNPVWQEIYGSDTPNKYLLARKFPLFAPLLKILQGKQKWKSAHLLRSNIFAIEHSWNEIYNSGYGMNPDIKKLFCNTTVSLDILQKLGAPPNLLESAGSPWLQLCDSFGKDAEKENLVLFLAPHNSWTNQIPNLEEIINQLTIIIRNQCDKAGWKFALKKRSKYMLTIDEGVFDFVVSDQNPLEHLELYSKAKIALHLCSSSVCEFAFTRTFAITMFPSLNLDIHNSVNRIRNGKTFIHNHYYNTDSFLKQAPMATFYENGDSIESIINNLISSSNQDIDWVSFQRKYFPSLVPHDKAGETILTQITSMVS